MPYSSVTLALKVEPAAVPEVVAAVQVMPLSTDTYTVSRKLPVPNAALKVPETVCAMVLVTKSLLLAPVSALSLKPVMAWAAGIEPSPW